MNAERRPAFGVRLGSVEFDMPAVVERKNRVVGTLTKGVEGMLKRAGVEAITGQARLVSRGVVEVGAARYEAANILLATGSRPGAAADSRNPLGARARFRHGFRSHARPGEIAIIGGGYIGLEFACFFNEVGAQVSVYEMLPQIAAGCDREISTRMLQIMKRKGIEFNLSAKVLGIEGNTIHYQAADGSQASASADCILNATGRAPVVRIWAWKKSASISLPRASRLPTRARPTWRAFGPAEMSPDGACWPMPPRAKASWP